jgi:hypothetical protein
MPPLTMDTCFSSTLIQQLRSLESQFLTVYASGADGECNAFSTHFKSTLAHARQVVFSGHGPPGFAELVSEVSQSFGMIFHSVQELEDQSSSRTNSRVLMVRDMCVRAGLRRRRKRSTRSRKSKAGKSGRVWQSGKKSKRGRKSPVGNPKRRVQLEVEGETSTSTNPSKRKPTTLDSSGRKCRTVTAPPTDSMKFGEFLRCLPARSLCTTG